uniref:Uncharacterized protein n=1 Tax=Triticum urartu TaxID=4572 RepID=A0A8R7K3M2_TRIUA
MLTLLTLLFCRTGIILHLLVQCTLLILALFWGLQVFTSRKLLNRLLLPPLLSRLWGFFHHSIFSLILLVPFPLVLQTFSSTIGIFQRLHLLVLALAASPNFCSIDDLSGTNSCFQTRNRSLNLHAQLRHNLVNWQGNRIHSLQMQSPHVFPLLGHLLHGGLHCRHHIVNNLLLLHVQPAHLDPRAGPGPQVQESGAEDLADLLRPAGAGEVDGDGGLLGGVEGLAEEAGQHGEQGAVGEEEVVGGGEAAARLVGAVVGAQGGEGDDLRDGQLEGPGGVEDGGGGGGAGAGAVVGDDADGGGRVGDDGVREREQVRLGGGLGRDAAERELEHDEVVALVGEQVRRRLGRALPHPLGEGRHGAGRRRARHLVRRLVLQLRLRRRRHGSGCGGGLGFRVAAGERREEDGRSRAAMRDLIICETRLHLTRPILREWPSPIAQRSFGRTIS